MFRDGDCYPNVNCGCSLSSFTPAFSKECPNCQELMWVVGRTQLLELRLTGKIVVTKVIYFLRKRL